MTCQACGAEVPPNSFIDVEDRGPHDDPRTHLGFRRAVACEACLDCMDADMWVSRAHWEALKPRMLFEDLDEVPT